MAGNAVIGALRVNLGLDSAEFQNGAKKAQSTLAGLGAAIKGFAAGAAAALSLGAVTAALKSSINHMDELNKAAQRIGIPVEELSKLEYAAKLADISLESLAGAVGKFSKAISQIAGGGSNDAGAALRAMGISATDANGQLRPTSDILADIAAKFAIYKDGAEKTALSMALFGKAGADMIPLLNGGREAISGASDQLARFGGVVTPEAAQKAEDFNDNLTRLQEAGRGLTTQLAEGLLPTLVDLTNRFVELVENVDITAFVEGLKTEFADIQRTGIALAGVIEVIGARIASVGQAANLVANGEFAAAWDAIGQGGERAAAIWEQTRADIAATLQTVNSADKTSLPSAKRTVQPPVLPDLAKTKAEADKAKKAMDDLKAAGQRVWEDTRTPLESYQLEIRNLNDLLAQGVIDHDTYARAVAQLQDQFTDTGKAAEDLGLEMAQSLGQTMQSWIDDAIQGTFDLKDALRGLLSQLTNLAMNSAFSNLFSGGGVAPSQAGGGLGGFFSNLFGFASGGTIMPGGTGGIDSQLVAFRKSPNERVDITKPGQTLGSRGDVNVTVINQSRAQVETTQDANGNPQLLIRDAVRGEISRAMKPILAAQYGITPKSQRR